MAEKQELTIATDTNGECYIHTGDTEWLPNMEQFAATDTVFRLRENHGIPPGHKARLTIGEAVDYRPKAVPEMSIERNSRGWLILHAARSSMILDPDLLPEVKADGHRCRIAWDEQGIRLIGTPERI